MDTQRHVMLGTLDQQVMLAIIRQQPGAYGVSVREEIERRTTLVPSFGAIYAALERLEQQGLVVSQAGEPTPERGGRSKLYFSITGSGRIALERSLSAIDAMRKGLKLKGAST
jgi:DNA-binding PadR family transcriptional regulator